MKLTPFLLVFSFAFFSQSCKHERKKTPVITETPEENANAPVVKTDPPRFNADSAFYFVEKQVSFGPRVPGTLAHQRCELFLTTELKKYFPDVQVQYGKATTWDGKNIDIKNIIASTDPLNKNRVLLCAHWDTRNNADQDSKDQNKAIDGANDGASGVGVLLEIARQLKIKPANIGVDIIFFDAEDWGNYNTEGSFCLGSQHWQKNLHTPDYKAKYGILLDMVGAADATFLLEGYSMQYAQEVLRKVWNNASALGHQKHFISYSHGKITDDHFYVNQAGIPCINIIDVKPNGGFGKFWHTHDDNMSVIDKNTLEAVGTTLLMTIYSEK